MRTHLAEGELLLLEQLNEKRTRYIQNVGRLLRAELGILRHDRNRSARCHVLQDPHEKFHHPGRQFNRLVLAGVTNAQRQWPVSTRQRRKPLTRRASKFNVLLRWRSARNGGCHGSLSRYSPQCNMPITFDKRNIRNRRNNRKILLVPKFPSPQHFDPAVFKPEARRQHQRTGKRCYFTPRRFMTAFACPLPPAIGMRAGRPAVRLAPDPGADVRRPSEPRWWTPVRLGPRVHASSAAEWAPCPAVCDRRLAGIELRVNHIGDHRQSVVRHGCVFRRRLFVVAIGSFSITGPTVVASPR